MGGTCIKNHILTTTEPPPILVYPRGRSYDHSFFNLHKWPDNNKSSVRLFAEDCVLYRNIEFHSLLDCLILQEDLDSLALLGTPWQMKFNVAKCHSMRVTRHYIHKQIPASANFGKRSVRKIYWHKNHREHWLGSTYLWYLDLRFPSQELGFRTYEY